MNTPMSTYWLLVEVVPQADGTSRHYPQFGDVAKHVVLAEKLDLCKSGFYEMSNLKVVSIPFPKGTDPLNIDVNAFLSQLDQGA